MASERQLHLSAIAILLCLLVFREISTLKLAEDARPARPDPAYVHIWKQLEADVSRAPELQEASASAADHAGGYAAAAAAPQRDDLRTTLVHDAGGRLGSPRLGSPRLGSLDVVFSAPAVVVPAVVAPALAKGTAPQPAAALAWRQGSLVQTAHSSSHSGGPVAPPPPLSTAAAKLLEEARPAWGPAAAAPPPKHPGGVGSSEDSADRSGEGRAVLAAASRANGTAPRGPGGGQVPFSGVFMCHDVSESYGAAWIIHKSKFLKTGFGPPWTAPFDTKEMAKPGWCVFLSWAPR